MFDDLDNKTSDNSSEGDDNVSTKEEASEASVQPTLTSAPSVSEAPKAPNKANSNAGIEDIFSDTDAGEVEPIKPAAFQPKADAGHGEELSGAEPKGNKFRKIIIPVVLIVVLGAIGAGGMYGYKYVINLIGDEDAKVINSLEEENTPDIPIEQDDADTDISELENIAEPSETEEPASDNAISEPLLSDTDGDGISDQEEISLGTNINSVDTDNDGLFDREEVYVYKTDPINEDTDGDGFFDGAEVQDGYNPNGPGKLYEIN
ncbi:hypothetical protein KAR28_05790 [Candidatus Parcubacteria bacterium]|nr:hypothetical protein [Candidatus Parcubacteria bacterium]